MPSIEPAWEPEWQPQFKAYNHTLGTPMLIFKGDQKRGWLFNCPCGQSFYLDAENVKEQWNNDSIILTCVNPKCLAWHSVLFKIPQPPRESPRKMTAKF